MPIRTAVRWLRSLPAAVRRMQEDVSTVRRNDPAARTAAETAILSPGVHAIWLHLVAHDLHTHGAPFAARALSHANRFLTGIEIHPGATLGRRVFIDHGHGIVIGETAVVGNDCLLFNGVVLGGVSLSRARRHPSLGDGVVVGSNACILGALDIGAGARIGSGSVVVRSVPERAKVVGVPARTVLPKDSHLDGALDHAKLPDPVAASIRRVGLEQSLLDARLRRLEGLRGQAPKSLPSIVPVFDDEDVSGGDT